MRLTVLGGGPAGLYFSLLMRQAQPDVQIRVLERNRADDTYGWGVVFSDETLGAFRDADPASFAAVRDRFRYWRDIETHYRGARTVSSGHGFAALGRRELLLILQERCRELGVQMEYEREVSEPEALRDCDLLVAADGVNSLVRQHWAQRFRPSVEMGLCRFAWFGTDWPLEAFTFLFIETEHGLFQVHAYPFSADLGTFIVECRDEVWRSAGLDHASEEESLAFCERLFAEHLGKYRLLGNRSIWRRFPTVRCEHWWFDNVVLLGDAAHTAHFSVGSGTKLAMEDAIALVAAFDRMGTGNVASALASYQEERWVDVLKTQKAADTSREWFEHSARYLGQSPTRFTFNLMTRSKRITYDELSKRDPALVAAVDAAFISEELGERRAGGSAASTAPPLFAPIRLRSLELANRVVVSPMCQYSAQDGVPGDWHLVHLGSRAVGGAGLVITEMTDVLPEGRITPGCAGLWNDDQTAAWRRIVEFVHRHSSARIGIQLAHAGRKGSAAHPWEGPDCALGVEEGWETCAPSALAWGPGWPAPREMDRTAMDRVRDAFVAATHRAEAADFDLVELHMAHGYLLSSYLSPLTNRRDDAYGGSLENRLRYPLEVFVAMRAAWPADRPLAVRISASDWTTDDSGMTPDESVVVARALRDAGCDLVDVSSAGNVPDSEVVFGRMYQVPFAEQIRYEVGMPVMAVGAILGADHANTVLAAGRADLVAMARPHLHDPYLTLHAAEHYGIWDHPWPPQYLAARPRPQS